MINFVGNQLDAITSNAVCVAELIGVCVQADFNSPTTVRHLNHLHLHPTWTLVTKNKKP
jgi:hypothetical protein